MARSDIDVEYFKKRLMDRRQELENLLETFSDSSAPVCESTIHTSMWIKLESVNVFIANCTDSQSTTI